MLYAVQIDFLGHAADSDPADLTEPWIFNRLDESAEAHNLSIWDLKKGGSVVLIDDDDAPTMVYEGCLATELLNFARTFAQSIGLSAVRIFWEPASWYGQACQLPGPIAEAHPTRALTIKVKGQKDWTARFDIILGLTDQEPG
jgi:hypothetical protein